MVKEIEIVPSDEDIKELYDLRKQFLATNESYE